MVTSLKVREKVSTQLLWRRKEKNLHVLIVKKKGHHASKCWKLHPEIKPEKFRNKEDKKTTVGANQHDLRSDSWDETKVVATSI